MNRKVALKLILINKYVRRRAQCETEIYKSLSLFHFGMLLFRLVFCNILLLFFILDCYLITNELNHIQNASVFFVIFSSRATFVLLICMACQILPHRSSSNYMNANEKRKETKIKRFHFNWARSGVHGCAIASSMWIFWAVNLFISYNKSSCNEVTPISLEYQ